MITEIAYAIKDNKTMNFMSADAYTHPTQAWIQSGSKVINLECLMICHVIKNARGRKWLLSSSQKIVGHMFWKSESLLDY